MATGARIGRDQGPTSQIERALAARTASRMMGAIPNSPVPLDRGYTARLQSWRSPYGRSKLAQPGPGRLLTTNSQKLPVDPSFWGSVLRTPPWLR